MEMNIEQVDRNSLKVTLEMPIPLPEMEIFVIQTGLRFKDLIESVRRFNFLAKKYGLNFRMVIVDRRFVRGNCVNAADGCEVGTMGVARYPEGLDNPGKCDRCQDDDDGPDYLSYPATKAFVNRLLPFLVEQNYAVLGTSVRMAKRIVRKDKTTAMINLNSGKIRWRIKYNVPINPDLPEIRQKLSSHLVMSADKMQLTTTWNLEPELVLSLGIPTLEQCRILSTDVVEGNHLEEGGIASMVLLFQVFLECENANQEMAERAALEKVRAEVAAAKKAAAWKAAQKAAEEVSVWNVAQVNESTVDAAVRKAAAWKAAAEEAAAAEKSEAEEVAEAYRFDCSRNNIGMMVLELFIKHMRLGNVLSLMKERVKRSRLSMERIRRQRQIRKESMDSEDESLRMDEF